MKSAIALRLKKGLFANFYSQGLNMAIQLVSVPIFLSYFSLETYGTWLMYFSASQFFLMADVGVFAIVMNRVTMSAGKHDWAAASHEFSNGLFWFFLSAPLVLAASAGSLAVLTHLGRLSPNDVWLVAALIAYALIFNLTGMLEAIFRAFDRYAQGVAILETTRAVEWLSLMAVLAITKSMFWIAIDLLVFRLVATICVAMYLAFKFHEVSWRVRPPKQSEIASLLRDGLAWIVYRVGDMVSLQGATVVIGAVLGGAAAATFNTYRTVTRLPLQVLNGAVNPYWPEFAKLWGQGNVAELAQQLRNAKKLTYRLVLVLYAGVLFVAPWFISFWSKNTVAYDWKVFTVMALSAVLLAVWYPCKVFQAATNKIGAISTATLVAYVLAVLIAVFVNVNNLVALVCIFLLGELVVAVVNIRACAKRVGEKC